MANLNPFLANVLANVSKSQTLSSVNDFWTILATESQTYPLSSRSGNYAEKTSKKKELILETQY